MQELHQAEQGDANDDQREDQAQDASANVTDATEKTLVKNGAALDGLRVELVCLHVTSVGAAVEGCEREHAAARLEVRVASLVHLASFSFEMNSRSHLEVGPASKPSTGILEKQTRELTDASRLGPP